MKTYFETKNKKDCYGCYACTSICPKRCIDMQKDKRGFYYPTIDKSKCIKCNSCRNVCPKVNHSGMNTTFEIQTYCANSRYKNTSTSGGIYPILAKYVISQNGVVFGVKYNEKMEAVFDSADNIEDALKFCRSKYVRANIKGILPKIQELLCKNIKVLFVGTPCQTAGVKNFLKNKLENLLLCDIFCYSNPSPDVLSEYIRYLEKKYNNKVTDIDFRDKSDGWISPKTKIYFKDKSIIVTDEDDVFYYCYSNQLSHRECCSDCDYTNLQRNGDLTIADFWGVDKFYPNLLYQEGMSQLIVNSSKGAEVFSKIKKNISYTKTKKSEVLAINHSKPIYNSRRQKSFFRLIKKKEMDEVYYIISSKLKKDETGLRKYYYTNIEKLKQKIKKIIRR